MRLRLLTVLVAILSIVLTSCGTSERQESSHNASANDSVYTALLIKHLRDNFDDIHDVSMRFHHLDHRLNGIIQIDMHWDNGRMTSSSVAINETGNREFADALIENIEKWYIEELTSPFDFSLPLKITIVGSDDSTFSDKGILTGEIADSSGSPIEGARLLLRSSSDSSDTLNHCYSNREGIFVKTLIPVGSWDLECTAPGFED
ncbi:MAG: carboxypeptidase-like regulatory domain-containing protein, partial [Candidatus Eisenbacteria bacterium]